MAKVYHHTFMIVISENVFIPALLWCVKLASMSLEAMVHLLLHVFIFYLLFAFAFLKLKACFIFVSHVQSTVDYTFFFIEMQDQEAGKRLIFQINLLKN